jgi:hypothetical protein
MPDEHRRRVRPRALLRLLRLPGCLTASADSLTAGLCATAAAGAAASGSRLALAATASFALYAMGIVAGDLRDLAKDRTLHPDRPLPSGEVSPAAARRLAIVLAALALGAGALAGLTALALVVATAAAVLLHVLVLKRSEPTAAVGMALCRISNLLLGAGFVGALTDLPLLLPAATGLYVVSLTGISAFEERREPRALLVLLLVLLLTAVLVPFPAFPQRGFPLATAAPLFLMLLWRAARARHEPSPGTVGALVGRAVTGFLLLDAAYLFGFGHAVAAVGFVVLYLALRLTKRARNAT